MISLFIFGVVFTPAFTQEAQQDTPKQPYINKAPQSVITTGRKVYVNYRAYAVPVDAVTARMVKEDDNVDILCALKTTIYGRTGTQSIVATLLQDMKVLEVVEIKGLNYLIIQASPIEIQYLSLALTQDVKVSLRTKGDNKISPIAIASFDSLEDGK